MNNPQSAGPVNNHQSKISLLHTLPLKAVQLQGGFWKARQEVNHRVSLHHAYQQLLQNGSFDSFRLCAGMAAERPADPNAHEGHDTDVYKWLEAVAWELVNEPDETLYFYVNNTVSLIEAAQAKDGYLVTPIMLYHPEKKWSDLNFGHEMYCAGHLIQAAIAIKRALGDNRLLGVASRFADHINSIFGPGKRSGTCGHPEIETALVELFRETGEERYLKLAQFLIEERGQRRLSGFTSYGAEYHQDHAPVRESHEAVGHAVRQMYLATGVADFVMESGEANLLDTLSRLWMDIFSTKMFVTGGVGARFDGEAFGDPYELPTDQCYCETCAAIGYLMWNWRMLLMTGEAHYADLIERLMYNAILSSPSLDGQHYFYSNPLMFRLTRSPRLSANRPTANISLQGRPEWHGVACCPPNVMRFLSSMMHYFVTCTPNGIQVHQYASMYVETSLLQAGKVGFEMQSEYPWKGEIILTIQEGGYVPWEISLRIPGWCQVYRVEVNGEVISAHADTQGYLTLARAWQTGDTLHLRLEIEPQFWVSNPRVDATRGCVALQHGPLIYCFEGHDQPPGTDLLDVQIDPFQPVRAEWVSDLLGGVMVLHPEGYVLNPKTWEAALYLPLDRIPSIERVPIELNAIPYYAWGNRGLGSMRVWVPMNSGK